MIFRNRAQLGFILLVATFLLASGPAACGGAKATPTPTFEQKRADVIRFLIAFNAIPNSLSATSANLNLKPPQTASELVAFNGEISKFITALQGAQKRMEELPPSVLEPDTSALKDSAVTYLSSILTSVRDLQQAIAQGNQAGILAQFTQLLGSTATISAINRATEQLLLKYNIPDIEVDYSSRGR